MTTRQHRSIVVPESWIIRDDINNYGFPFIPTIAVNVEKFKHFDEMMKFKRRHIHLETGDPFTINKRFISTEAGPRPNRKNRTSIDFNDYHYKNWTHRQCLVCAW